MSGNQRLDIGDITQSGIKGNAMESALASALNDATPHPKERQSKNPNAKSGKGGI